MPFYKIDKNIYNVPESDVEEFEKNNPNATVRYQHGKNVYDVPVSERGQFLDNMKDVVPFDWDPYFDGGKKGGKTDAVQPEGKRNQAAYIEDATAGMGQRTPTDAKHSDGSMPESEIQRLKKIKYDAQQEIDSAGFFDRFFNPETRMAVATRNQAEQALETYEEAKHSDNGWFDRNVLGVFRGIGDKIGDLDTWDFGASGIASAVALKDAAEKSERGEPLTASERRMLDAYGLASAVQSAYQDKVGMAYNVGTSLPESAGFMVSLAANPAAGLGKKVAERAAKTAVKKYGKTLVSKLAKGAARAGGDMAEMAIATATTGAGRVAEDYYNRLNGEQTFDIDDNGIIRWGGRENQEEADAAIWKAFGSQFIENYSEKMGEYMSPLGKKIGEYMSPLGEMISGLTYKGLKKANLNNLADEIGRISSSQLSTGIQKLKEKTLYDGLVGEYLEEVAGNIMNASTVGDMNFGNPEDPRSVFNPETNIETFLSCALMSGTMLAVETSVNTYNSRKMKRSLDDADKNASGLWGEDRWSDMRNQMDESDPQQLAQWISSINNSDDLSDEQKKAAMGYAGRLLQYQAFNARKMQNQMESTEETNAINNSYDEGTETVEPAERHEAKIRMERAESALGANSGDAERESFASMVMAGKDNPVESIRKMGEQGYTEEQIENAKEYYVSYFRMKGMTDSLLDDVESQVQQYNNDIDNNTHKDYGYVMRVQLNDGTEGFVIEGFVVQGQTGEIDGTASDDEVAVRMKDGQKRIMNPAKDIKTILSTNNAEDMKEYIDVVKRQQLIDNALGEINWNPSTPEPKVGDVFERNGQNVVVVSVDENGNMTVAPEEEERKSEGDISKIENTENVPVSEFKDFASAQIDAQQQQGNQQHQPSDINQTDDARTPEETPVNTPEIPTDKDGNIDFVKFGEENTMKFLSDTYGESSKERVKATTDSYEEELKKAEAAMQKAKSALDKAPIGKDIKQKKTYDTAVEAYNRAKTEFDFWNAINGRLNVPERQQSKDGIPLMDDGTPDFVKFGEDNTVNHMIEKYGEKSTLKAENTMKDAAKELESAKAEVEKAMKEYDNAPVGKEEKAEKKLAEAEAKLQNAKRHSDFWSGVFKQVQSRQKNPSAQAAAEIREMIEPSNGEELAANAVSGGGIRLLMDSFMKETGYSKEEARKFIGIFASKENGGLTIEEAGERLMQEDRENGANLFDQSDPNAGRNALIEMLSKTRTRGDITNFVRNNREEQARREEEAAMEAESQAKEEWSAQNFHMGYDDMQSYYEQFIQSSIESSMSRGEYDEFMANFADETINTEQYEQGISTESNQGDQVLPQAQPDFAGGEEVLQGGSGQDNNNSIDKGVPVQEGAPGSERLNAGSPVPSDNIEDVLAEAERISKEDEIQRTAASFPEETQEKASAFDGRIPGMTDEELLAYMREDGNGDSNGAYHPALYDEYDNRHVKDVSDSYDGYLQSLMDSGTTVEQAEEMLSNLTGDLSRFATSERPYLLGQEEALRDYISKLNQEVPAAPSEEDVYSRIEQASHEVDTNPTEAQIKAGNYKKGHVRVDGYDVTIENPKGSVRRGTDAIGKEWSVTMNNTYGYIRGTEGVDGDHIDVFFSEDPSQGDVFVVDQVNKDGSFDEHKVMYGFASEEEARKAYLSNYEEGWQGLGAITHVSKDEFKKWVESSHRKTKPFADYKNVKEITEDVDQRRTNVDKDGLVVDAEGNPLTLYHGTPNDFEFSSLESGHVRNGEEVPARFNGNGISFTPDRTVATEYATSEGGKGKVFEVNVTLKKPYFTVGVANFTPEEAAAFTEGLIAKGYDGIINYSSKWMREAGALPSEVIVFDKSSLIPAEDGQVSEKTATYKTKDGKSVAWQSLFNEAEMRGESPVETDNIKKNTAGNQTDRKNHGETPTGIRLRKLEDGEICHVERIYEETGLFNFTGKEKIESLDDVAYIFKQLEDASVENTFLVLVKDDKPTVIHLAIGDYSSSYAPFRQAFLAYKELNPESVILVHNHPSGTLKASYQDIQIIQDIQKVFGKDVVEPGIIIDTTSGKYGMFDATTNETERMPSKQEDAVPLKVFRFSRQVFSPGWNPDTAFKITSSRDVASFVSSHRLGQRKKMSLIVTNNAGNITANLFLPWTRISEVSNIKDACDMLSAYIHQCGGTRGIIYGNYQIDSDAPNVINKISYRMNQLGTPLLDVIHIDHSARDEGMVGEPSSERIDNESGTRYQKSEENRTVPEREASLRDALVESLRSSGIEVIADSEEGQRVLDEANGSARMQAKKRALETASLSEGSERSLTVVSSADGAKILKNIDVAIQSLDNSPTQPKTFVGDIANALGATRHNSKSEYATFETKNGRIVTIRLADHNATVSNFDRRGELDGISIVISPKKSGGITNDGDAHVVEYYYDAIKLRRADGKPLADIVRSIKQALYSGEFEDTTGLAERQEVNADEIRQQKVYHGSGADFDAFDHSHMGEGEGNQAFGWGTYVTEVEAIGRTYAKANNNSLRKSKLESDIRRLKEALPFRRGDAKREGEEELKRLEEELSKFEDWKSVLYTVEIPDDNGTNYLGWGYAPMNSKQYEMWYDAMRILGEEEYYSKPSEMPNGVSMFNAGHEINSLGRKYSPENVSKALSKAGFAGIYYSSQYNSGGNEEGKRNYVIFNEADAKITGKVRFFRTGDGHAYGFTAGGKIYIDPRIATSETPIHEYAHLWASAMRSVNPTEWRHIVSLMKGTSVWEEVKGKYPELKTDDEIADEVLATYSGRRGAEMLRSAEEEILKNGKDAMPVASALDAINKVKDALKRFWKGVADFLGVHFTTAEEVADKVMADLLNGVNPNSYAETGFAKGSEEAAIVEKAKADGTYMKAPNGEKSNLNSRQWVQVRTKAFKEWFGDWEKAARIEKLRKIKGASITGKEIEISDDYKQNKKNALEYGKKLQGEYTNADTGISVQLQRGRKNGGIKEVLQHNYKDIPHVLSVAAIPQIIEKSIHIESEPNNDIAKNPDVVEYQHFVCGLKIGNEDYTVHSLVAVDKHGNRYYDHNLTKIEKTKLLDQIEGQAVNGQGFDATSGTEPTTLNGYKDKKPFSILQANCSKVVDENGEPMVVYHGSGDTFTIFSPQSEWHGNFFSSERSVAESYSPTADNVIFEEKKRPFVDVKFKDGRIERQYYDLGGIYNVYLDIKKPLLVDCKGKNWNDIHFKGIKTTTDHISDYALKQGCDGVIFINLIDGAHRGLEASNTFVAFNPNQIKSATDNIGTFDGNNPDIRYQFVGEKGAAEADKMEEATVRLDNLGVARDMEKAGKDERTIKLATGWERGGDGKWRYEIEDFDNSGLEKIVREDNKKKLRLSEHRRTLLGRKWEMEDEIYPDRYFDEFSDEEREQWDRKHSAEIAELNDLIKEIDRLKKQENSSDIITDLGTVIGKAHVLLKYYPELENVVVHITSMPSSVGGIYKSGVITLNRGALYDSSILNHEVQHAIQEIEGFARGGSVRDVRNRIRRRITELDGVSEHAKEMLARQLEYRALSSKIGYVYERLMKNGEDWAVNTASDIYWEAMNTLDNDENSRLNNVYPKGKNASEIAKEGFNREKAIDELKRLSDYYASQISAEDMNNIKASESLSGKIDGKSDEELYLALGGEVEARNVQARLGMTTEERRRSLASETEDVAREDQIFLEDSLGVSKMGSRVDGRMAEIGRIYDGRELDGNARKLVDVYSGKSNNETITVERDGKAHKVVMRQGAENKAGTKHSVLRHYGTGVGTVTADDLLLIPEVLGRGQLEEKGRKRVYRMSKGGVIYTVLTEYNNGREDFSDFYSNRKGGNISSLNTQLSARGYDATTNSAAKVVESFENPSIDGEKSKESSEKGVLYRTVSDRQTIDRLEKEPKIRAYRAMQVIDGKMYSPMAAKIDGKLASSNPIGAWTEAEETVFKFTDEQKKAMEELDNSGRKGEVEIIKGRLRYRKDSSTGKGKIQFHLVKGDGTDLWAAYNPYIHSSMMMLNDQFTSAYKRPNIVVVEVEIPKSELTSGYRADMAKDPVGITEWKAGPVAGQLPSDMGRKVMLSRWSKVVRIVPYSEVAEHVSSILDAAESKTGKKITLPVDSFHPELRKELEKRGFSFEYGKYTEERKDKDGKTKRKAWDELSDTEKSKEYNGAEYMDDAAISELNNELSGQWMKREGNMPANTSSAADRMAEKARSISQKLNLDNVEIVTDSSTLEGKKRRAKGFYERSTGKITIVVPNHTGMADIEQTLLHEAVAHYGLRKLMGDKFGDFLDYVYQQASGPMREKINALAEKNGWDFHTATEEYLASLAEDTDFAHRYRIWWGKVKSELLRLLGKIGFKNLSSDGITDNELRYMLWRSYRNLSESGRYRSILGEAEDIVMQDKLKVGNYAESTLFRSVKQKINGMQDNTARNMYEAALREKSFRLTEAFVDAQRALKEIQDAIAAQHGGKIEEWEDAYTTENQLSSRNTIEVEKFMYNHLRPMVDAVSALSKKGGVSYDEIKNYLFMKSGLERNRDFAVRDAIAKKKEEGDDTKGIMEGYMNSKAKLLARLKSGSITFREYCSLMDNAAKAIAPDILGRDYSGLSSFFPGKDAFADMALDVVELFEQRADTSAVWGEIRKATQFSLDKAKDSGVISTDTHKRVSGMFEWYIPMRGWNDTTADEVYDYFDSKGTGVFNNTVKAAKGRTTLAYDPLATIANMAESAIFQGNRNKMKQHLLNLAFNKPTNLITVMDSWIVNRGKKYSPQWEYAYPSIGENDTADEVATKISDFERDMENLRSNKMAKKVKGKADIPYIATPKQVSEHIIRVKRNGREFTMVINGNPRAAQAINGKTKADTGEGVVDKTLSNVNKRLSPMLTSYNPTFTVSNFSRDFAFSNAAVFIKEDNAYGKRFRSNSAKIIANIRGLMKRYQSGRLDMNNPLDKAFKEFTDNGGETGFVQLTSTEQYKKKIDRMIKEAQNGKGKARKAIDFYIDHVQFYNRCAEDINRFNVFLTSREMGRSIMRSVSDAKEITVNFNRSGAGAKTGGFFGKSAQAFRGLYVFFNACVQSLANFNMLREKSPGKFAATLSVFAATGFMIPFMNSLVGSLLGGDDDDYYDLPEWTRRNNIILSLGRIGGKPVFFKIPLPIEMRAFYGLGETANNLIGGKIKGGDAAMQVVSQFAELLPVNFMEGGGFVNSVMPTAIKPITEIAANKDFTGKPIYRDNGFNRDMPEWTKAYAGTSKMIVNATELANKLTGGDKYSPGVIDLNPAWIDHLIGGYSGGFGQSISEIAGLVYAPFAGEMPSANRIPVIKAFLNVGDERTKYSKVKKDYFEYKKEYEQVVRRLNGYKQEMKAGDNETAVEYAERMDFLLRSKEMRIYPVMKVYEKAINGAYDKMKQTQDPDVQKSIEESINILKARAVHDLQKLE